MANSGVGPLIASLRDTLHARQLAHVPTDHFAARQANMAVAVIRNQVEFTISTCMTYRFQASATITRQTTVPQ